MNLQRVADLQSKLRGNCHVSIEHVDLVGAQWKASISTEGNAFPYWIQFTGASPSEALSKLFEYLLGQRPDHARDAREPSVFLKESL